jgi:hypothetical protein
MITPITHVILADVYEYRIMVLGAWIEHLFKDLFNFS